MRSDYSPGVRALIDAARLFIAQCERGCVLELLVAENYEQFKDALSLLEAENGTRYREPSGDRR